MYMIDASSLIFNKSPSCTSNDAASIYQSTSLSIIYSEHSILQQAAATNPATIIKLPSCLTLLTLETYNLCFIASKLLTVADMMAIGFQHTAIPGVNIESSPVLDTSCLVELIYDLINKKFLCRKCMSQTG